MKKPFYFYGLISLFLISPIYMTVICAQSTPGTDKGTQSSDVSDLDGQEASLKQQTLALRAAFKALSPEDQQKTRTDYGKKMKEIADKIREIEDKKKSLSGNVKTTITPTQKSLNDLKSQEDKILSDLWHLNKNLDGLPKDQLDKKKKALTDKLWDIDRQRNAINHANGSTNPIH